MSVWGVSWGDSWGWSWGPLYEVEEPLVKLQVAVSVSGGNKVSVAKPKPVKKKQPPKIHLVELYKTKVQEELDLLKDIRKSDDDLLTLIGFLISNSIVV